MFDHRFLAVAGVVLTLIAGALVPASSQAAESFQAWLQQVKPQALRLGVSAATFDRVTGGLTPDLSLPDLAIPGRKQHPVGQPEFVLTPGDYLKPRRLAGLAVRGRRLAARYRDTLARIEQVFGVPANILLAIWGRETDFGRERETHNAIRVLATQAYIGRRKAHFRDEFLLALKMLQQGDVRLAAMRSSWAGAMGLTQFLPSEFFKYAVDFDGDGKRDIWHSVPDALASAAKQLVAKGWQRGGLWGIEVRAPKTFDCSQAQPAVVRPIGAWLKHGFVPLGSRKLTPHERTEDASVLMPEGTYGAAFLTPKNYFVIKEYNYSDLYVLFVGNLADRIAGGGGFVTRWSKSHQLRTVQVEEMQRQLTQLGFYKDKIDGKAGMLTRAALGAYQKANGLRLDCWPSEAVLAHMRAQDGRN